MKPVQFKEANVVLAKDQPEYLPLPALSFDDKDGIVISCWSLSFWECIKLLFTGKIWVSTMTFKEPLQPLYITVHKDEVIVYGITAKTK